MAKSGFLPLVAVHRALGLCAGALLLYVGVTGVVVQSVDLAAILRQAPATDPDMIAIRESLNGPGNYAVIAAPDYAAAALPADTDIPAAFARAAAHATAPPRWIEMRMVNGHPVVQAMVEGAVRRFDPANGQPLPDPPTIAAPDGPSPSAHLAAKRWHRLWALGDGLLWIDALGGVALGMLVCFGLAMWWRLWRARLRMGRRALWWSAGGRVRAWHRGLALVAALPLLVVSISGTVLSIDSLSLAVYRWRHPDRLMFGMVPVGMVADESGPLSPAAAARMAAVTMAANGHRAVRVLRVRLFAGMPQGVVITADPEPRQRVFDTRSGRRVSMNEPGYPDTVFPTGWEWHERIKRIHRGDWLGLPGRLLDLLAGLSLVWFAGSGVWIYAQLWRRRARGGRRAPFWR